MADMAHQWTDRQIQALGNEIDRIYASAKQGLVARLDELLGDFDSQNREWVDAVARGETSESDYGDWLDEVAYDSKEAGRIASELAKEATRTNKAALAVIASAVMGMYLESANLSAYEFETRNGIVPDGLRPLAAGSVSIRSVLPRIPKIGPDGRKDYAWNRRKIMAVVMSAVIAGSSLPEVRARVSSIYDMDRRAVRRTAVTVATAVESVGKLDTYGTILASGIPVEKEWVAVMDNRTRLTHRELDGQTVPIDEPFVIGSTGETIRYPGDPEASPSEVYNCRCGLDIKVAGSIKDDLRLTRLPEGLTYEDWKSGKWV